MCTQKNLFGEEVKTKKSVKPTELLHQFAFDKNLKIVFISDAIKGVEYICPNSGETLVVKDSGKVGKGTKRKHFAYKSDNANNTNEGFLHEQFKLGLASILQEKIKDSSPFFIDYSCKHCYKPYNINILQTVANVAVEYTYPSKYRSDIALLNAQGYPIIAIEVIVSHPVEPKTNDFYKNSGIILIQLEVSKDDLLNIERKASKPDDVNFCSNWKCRNDFMNWVKQYYKPYICEKCGKPKGEKRYTLHTPVGNYKIEGCKCPSPNSRIPHRRNKPRL